MPVVVRPEHRQFNLTEAYVIRPDGSELSEYGIGGTTWTHTNLAGIATYDASEVHFHVYD